jgi:hypothetical protein
VTAISDTIPKFDAGVGFGRDLRRRETSADGFELRFALNYSAPFKLTELLVARSSISRAVVTWLPRAKRRSIAMT